MKHLVVFFVLCVLLFSCNKDIKDSVFSISDVSVTGSDVSNAPNAFVNDTIKITFNFKVNHSVATTKIVAFVNDAVILTQRKNTIGNDNILATDNFFYITSQREGVKNYTLSIQNENSVILKTLTSSITFLNGKIAVVNVSNLSTRTLLKNQADTLNYLVVSLDNFNQKLSANTIISSGSSVELVQNKVNGISVNSSSLGSASVNVVGVPVNLTPTQIQYILDKKLLNFKNRVSYSSVALSSTESSGTIEGVSNIKALQFKIPIRSTEVSGISVISTDIASSSSTEKQNITDNITVTDENFAFDYITANKDLYVLESGGVLEYSLSTSDQNVQLLSDFSMFFTCANGDENVIEISKNNIVLGVGKNYNLNSKITRDANGNVLVNKWDGIVNQKNTNGILITKATIKDFFNFRNLSEKPITLTWHLVSNGGKEQTKNIVITPKTTLPDWSSTLFTNKLGLSEGGFSAGSIAGKYTINVIDANKNAKYDVRIQKNFLNGSNGAWDLDYINSRIISNQYLNWSINNSKQELSLKTNIPANSLNSLVGKYEVVTTFKRNYNDANGVNEYVRRDTLEIWDDRIDVDVTKYNTAISAVNANLEMFATSVDTLLYSFDIISEKYKSAYRNYTIKIECEGDPIDIALTTFKINTYSNNTVNAYQSIELGKEYYIGSVGENTMHIKINPTRFSVDRSNRFIQNVKITITDTRTNAKITKSVGSLKTNYVPAKMILLDKNTPLDYDERGNNNMTLNNVIFSNYSQNNSENFTIFFGNSTFPVINAIKASEVKQYLLYYYKLDFSSINFSNYVSGTQTKDLGNVTTLNGTFAKTFDDYFIVDTKTEGSVSCQYGSGASYYYGVQKNQKYWQTIKTTYYNLNVKIIDNHNNIIFNGLLPVNKEMTFENIKDNSKLHGTAIQTKSEYKYAYGSCVYHSSPNPSVSGWQSYEKKLGSR